MKIAILTSSQQWFEDYAEKLSHILGNVPVYNDHSDITSYYEVLFILSYHEIIDNSVLARNKYNIVVHESDLPRGKGWAPFFWQVLEGKSEIVFTMFEAAPGVDAGDIYMKRSLALTGLELNPELRHKQAELTIQMCTDFIASMSDYLPPRPQKGGESFYSKRNPQDSQLDLDKTIREQFNLLRISNNDDYPAFIDYGGKRYLIKIEESS